MPHRHTVDRYASTGHTTDGRWWVDGSRSICGKSAFGSMTLTFDLWPWKPFQHSHSHDEHLWQVSQNAHSTAISCHGVSRKIDVNERMDNGRMPDSRPDDPKT